MYMSSHFFVVQYLKPFLVIQSCHLGRELVALLRCLLISCDCYCIVYLPQIDVGWSVLCDCGISWSYSLFIVNSTVT